MSDFAVEVEDLTKEYQIQRGWKAVARSPWSRDTRVVLDRVNLQVGHGEFFGILGQNGAGKSTLFRILSTLVRPDSGSARVMGHDVAREAAEVRDRLIPVIPSERSLYWRVSAEENLRLYAALYGVPAARVDARISEVLELVGLQDTMGKQVGLYSSGMKQRLLIARALLGSPDVLLLDEPTRSMDPVSARDFRSFLKRQVSEVDQTTVLLATHDHEEVTELCERVAVLDRGRLLAVGPTDSLLASSKLRRCGVWTRHPDHPAIPREVARIGGRVLEVPTPEGPVEAGWSRVTVEFPGGEEEGAALLARLTAQGVSVSRFTRVDLSLADLLERVRDSQAVPATRGSDVQGQGAA